MKYKDIVKLFKNRPFFESDELNIMFDEPSPQIQARLSRWSSLGKLIKLRKKKYLLPEDVRAVKPSLNYISNYLYFPSCVGLRSALFHYGLIPEAVYLRESVTPRKTYRQDTEIGTFKYYSIKKERFWGAVEENDKNRNRRKSYYISEPERTILDVFYFMKGDWTAARIKEMRFQNLERLSKNKLIEYNNKFDSQKVGKAVSRFIEVYSEELK